MSNVDRTVLKSNDAVRFDEITKDIEFQNQISLHRIPGEIFVESAWGVPHEEIKKLSKKHPDMVFKAAFSFEDHMYDTKYHVEYKVGKDEVVDAEPSYTFPVLVHIEMPVLCRESLVKRVEEVFKRVDPVVDDPEDGKRVDWCDAEVTVDLENDGYRIRAKKQRNVIEDIQVFKAREKKGVEWIEI
jgi:hypothetical protein